MAETKLPVELPKKNWTPVKKLVRDEGGDENWDATKSQPKWRNRIVRVRFFSWMIGSNVHTYRQTSSSGKQVSSIQEGKEARPTNIGAPELCTGWFHQSIVARWNLLIQSPTKAYFPRLEIGQQALKETQWFEISGTRHMFRPWNDRDLDLRFWLPQHGHQQQLPKKKATW